MQTALEVMDKQDLCDGAKQPLIISRGSVTACSMDVAAQILVLVMTGMTVLWTPS